MKNHRLLLLSLAVFLVAYILFDVFYLSGFEKRFKSLERERIVTSNQLATAKIIAENLNHVRDLVFKNMDFAGNKDTVGSDLGLFLYLTECAQDLKMRILSVKPLPGNTKGRVTTYAYDVEMSGDFFSFGEFCSKLENNRRIMSLVEFDLAPIAARDEAENAVVLANTGVRALRIKMRLHTFRVKK